MVNTRLLWRLAVIGASLMLAVCGVALALRTEGPGPVRPGLFEPHQSRPAQLDCPDQRFGLHMDLTYEENPSRRARAIAAARSVGAQVSRNSLLWHRIESERGDFDWRVADAVVDELDEGAIEPLFVVYGSPSWANRAARSLDRPELFVPTSKESFSAWVQEYAAFMRVAARRYKGQVRRWEIWNEPNEENFWRPAPDVEQYEEYFRALHKAIRDENPSAEVAVGGLSGLTETRGRGTRGVDFAQQLLSRNVPFDHLALHPYPKVDNLGQPLLPGVADVRSLLALAGRDVEMWVTEWGWSTEDVTEDVQAQLVGRSLVVLRNEHPYVAIATLFIDHDRPPRFSYGVFDSELEPKPAAVSFSRFIQDSGPVPGRCQGPGELPRSRSASRLGAVGAH